MKQLQRYQLQKLDPAQVGQSLFTDLRTRIYNDDDLQCLMLYEADPLSLIGRENLLYVKVIVLTQEGRKQAEYRQREIISRYGVNNCDSARFIQAFARAMTLWDCEHEPVI